MKVSVHIEEWPLIAPFRITGFEWTKSRPVVVELAEDGFVGCGEAGAVFLHERICREYLHASTRRRR